MRLVSWNLAHQCREEPIPPSFIEAVSLLKPDLISLNEYVHGPSRVDLISRLYEIGLRHIEVSQRLNGHNQVLIASCHPITLGHLSGPETQNLGGQSNFLHVSIPAARIEFVGLRAPSYTGISLEEYWYKLTQIIQSCTNRPIVFMGDFNTDPDQPRRSTAKHLLQLRCEGWSVPRPEGSWSFISKTGNGTRIDHAVLSPCIKVISAQYVAVAGSVTLAAPSRKASVSDHAALVVNIDTPLRNSFETIYQ